MSNNILIHQYDNGLVLVAEVMDWLESAAFSFLVPGGCSRDPLGKEGLSNFTCEMVQRGCGERDSRQFVDDLDNLGVDRGASVSNAHSSYGGAMLAENLNATLSIYADLLRRPHLPEQQMDEGLMVCLQELRAVDDDLGQKLMINLRQQQYPDPWGRACQGTLEALHSITVSDVQRQFESTYRPNGAVLSVAGKIAWEPLKAHVGELLGDWTPVDLPEVVETNPEGRYKHIAHQSSQTHIGVAYPSVPYRDPDYYQARGAVGVLSDGMSSRLFTEVREKRGLCYTVYAMSHSLRDRGSVLCYSGTSTDRAQETLDVLLGELKRLSAGVEQDELDRLKARIKSTLIMQQESSRSRSSSIATDWYHLGRVQTLDEIGGKIDALSCDSINAYLAEHPPADFNVVTLGEKELEVTVGVS